MDKLEDIWADLKRAHKSLTQWFNVVVVPVSYQVSEYAFAEFPALEAHLDKPTFAAWMTFIIVGNSMLRFHTKTSMSNK